MGFLIFVGIFAFGSLIGVLVSKTARGLMWPIRRAADEWRYGRRRVAGVLVILAVGYVLTFLIWLSYGSQHVSTLIWTELGICAGIWLTPVVMAPQPRPDHREQYRDDDPAMQDESWRYQ